MDLQRAVLDALVDRPHAAAELADRLGSSPEAVREAVRALEDGGFGIERADGGYRIASVPDSGIGAAFELDAPFSFEHHRSIASTNDRARELAAGGAADVVVVADEQTAGRGRRGRGWSSPWGGVYLSAVLRPDLEPARAPLLTLGASVATAWAARDAGVDARIKWPNDVLVDGRKLAGVLTESASAEGRLQWVVVGVGANADVDPGRLPGGSTSLREHADRVDRRRFARRLLEGLHRLRSVPAAIPAAWRANAATLGRRVRVGTPGGEVVGEAADVGDDGALVVETSDGRVRVTAGDCEHLRPA